MNDKEIETDLETYNPERYYDRAPDYNTTLILGTIVVVALVMYLVLKSRTKLAMPLAKQWQIKYNEDGLMSNITSIEMPRQ